MGNTPSSHYKQVLAQYQPVDVVFGDYDEDERTNIREIVAHLKVLVNSPVPLRGYKLKRVRALLWVLRELSDLEVVHDG
jgi:hypothetical protein